MIYAMLLVAGFLLGVMFARRKRRGEVFGRRERLRAAVDELVPPPLTGELIRARFERYYANVPIVHPCPCESAPHIHVSGGLCIHTVRAWLDREGLGAWEPRWDEGARRFAFVRRDSAEACFRAMEEKGFKAQPMTPGLARVLDEISKSAKDGGDR